TSPDCRRKVLTGRVIVRELWLPSSNVFKRGAPQAPVAEEPSGTPSCYLRRADIVGFFTILFVEQDPYRLLLAGHIIQLNESREKQAAYLFVALRQKILAIPHSHCRRLLNISDPNEMARRLKEM